MTKKRTKRKKKVEATVTEDGKLMCPACNTSNLSNVKDYSLSRSPKKGKFVFHRECLNCGVDVRNYRSFW